jgi:peptide/nickel transport system permease protein
LIVGAVVILSITANLISPFPPDLISLDNKLAPPSWGHPFGTDYLGRDTLSRVIYGTRSVVEIIVYSLALAGIAGTILGAFSGFYGGYFDVILMRAIDILMSFPAIILALAVVAILGASLENAIIAMSIYQIAPYARLIRGQILVERELAYVENARAIGARDTRILFRHVMPNVIGPLLVQMNFSTATVILGVAGLSFFGLGAQPPTAEWGLMIFNARSYFYLAPATLIFPGIALFLVIYALNIVGETLRDSMDPRLKSRIKIF